MKIKIFIILSILSSAYAQNETNLKIEDKKENSKSLVIKVISGKDVISKTARGKEVENQLNEDRLKRDKELKAEQQSLEKDLIELRTKAKIVDQETLEKDQAKILRKEKELKAKAESSQEEFQRLVNRKLMDLNTNIQDTIVKKARENDWDIVSVKETGEIIYASRRVDATDEIIKADDLTFSQQKKAKEKPVIPSSASKTI